MYKNKKIIIYYNILLQNDFKQIMNQQMYILKTSNLFKIFDQMNICTSYLNDNSYQQHLQFVKNYFKFDSRFKIIQNGKSIPFQRQQNPTLQMLYNNCENNSDQYIFYFQALGVTRHGKQSWRLLITHNLLHNCQQNFQRLQNYDVIGSLFTDETGYGKLPHYAGNFWLTTSNHIRTLDINYLHKMIHSRWTNQFFIGTSRHKDVKYYTIRQHPKNDLYSNFFNLLQEVENE